MKDNNAVERAARFYSFLLKVYPTGFKQEFEQPMLQTFKDHYEDTLRTEGKVGITFWLEVTIDEMKNIAKEHINALTTKKLSFWVKWSAVSIAAMLLLFFVVTTYTTATQPDTQCTTTHPTTSQPPAHLLTATDYFLQGDYEYDRGSCTQAITAYTRSIQLNPNYPESYNNRAYTYMRMQDYQDALPDLDRAIALNQRYVQALMNRGDLYNYYGPIINQQKAIEDYDKVIALGGTHSTSVCGHKAMAETNGILPFAFLRFFTNPGC